MGFIAHVMGLRVSLAVDEQDAGQDDEYDPFQDDDTVSADADMAAQPVVVRRQPATRRVFRYEQPEDKPKFQGVPEGPHSWQQFFSDSQVAKLITPRLAIFSAYDIKTHQVRVGRFQLCYKARDGWRCRCSVFAVSECCVQIRAAVRLEAQKDQPMFATEADVMEVEQGVLWAVRGNGVLFEAVYRRLDGSVMSFFMC